MDSTTGQSEWPPGLVISSGRELAAALEKRKSPFRERSISRRPFSFFSFHSSWQGSRLFLTLRTY